MKSKKEKFQLLQGFFSLTPSEAREYRIGLFSQIHDIIFHGNGGFDYMTVYNMPLWLRKFTFNKLNAHYEELNSQKSGTSTDNLSEARSILQKAQQQKTPQQKKTQPKVKVPDFVTSTRKTSQK